MSPIENDVVAPLDADTRALLREHLGDATVARLAPDGAKDRVRARLAASMMVAAGVGAAGGLGAANVSPLAAGTVASVASRVGEIGGGMGASTVTAKVGFVALHPWLWTVSTLLLGGAIGAAVYGAIVPAQTRIVYVDRPVTVEATPPKAPEPRASLDVPAKAPRAPAQSAPTAATLRASQLAAERALLDGARAALVQGDAAHALSKLEQHRRAFTAPLLADERDAMGVQALVKAGKYADARAAAEAFQKRSPGSLFQPMVDGAIASIPPAKRAE